MSRNFIYGVLIGAAATWWWTRPGKGGASAPAGKQARGRMSWSGLGRFR